MKKLCTFIEMRVRSLYIQLIEIVGVVKSNIRRRIKYICNNSIACRERIQFELCVYESKIMQWKCRMLDGLFKYIPI